MVEAISNKLASLPLGSAPELNCTTCEFIMSVYVEVAGNQTTLGEFVQLFEDACSVIAPGTPLGTLCDALISDTFKTIIPFLYKELTTLAWDIPETFCSVFIPVCTVDCCATPTAPEQRRLAYTNDASAYSVQWTTLTLVAGSAVEWGVYGASGQPSAATAVPRTYALGGWQGTLYSAIMDKLQPGVTYSYRVGSDSGGWSAAANFSTLPAATGSAQRALRLAHIGDMGWGNNSNNTIAALQSLVDLGALDAVIHTGDVSYSDGQQKSWDVYGRKIEGISSRVPYMVGVGNHEQVWWGGRPFATGGPCQPPSIPSPVSPSPTPPLQTAAFTPLTFPTRCSTLQCMTRSPCWTSATSRQTMFSGSRRTWGWLRPLGPPGPLRVATGLCVRSQL